jgi:ABC-type amino acid transport substrate-binding protein
VVVARRGQGQAGAARVAGVADWPTWAAGKTLAVERGAAGHALARDWARLSAGRALTVTVLAEPTIEEALLAVENQSADAALADIIDAYNFMQGHLTVTLAGPPVTPEPYSVAVSIRGRVLSQEIEQALQAMEADGTLSTLRVKWFGEAAR